MYFPLFLMYNNKALFPKTYLLPFNCALWYKIVKCQHRSTPFSALNEHNYKKNELLLQHQALSFFAISSWFFAIFIAFCLALACSEENFSKGKLVAIIVKSYICLVVKTLTKIDFCLYPKIIFSQFFIHLRKREGTETNNNQFFTNLSLNIS